MILEQKAHQLNQQLVARPKVRFPTGYQLLKGSWLEFAKVVGLKQNALFAGYGRTAKSSSNKTKGLDENGYRIKVDSSVTGQAKAGAGFQDLD